MKKLYLVIPIVRPEDLNAIAQSEGWHTRVDLLRKTGTSFNTHWNGKHVLDQDEKPWNASEEDIAALTNTNGEVVALSEGEYHISAAIPLLCDKDGSVYAAEDDLEDLLKEVF